MEGAHHLPSIGLEAFTDLTTAMEVRQERWAAQGGPGQHLQDGPAAGRDTRPARCFSGRWSRCTRRSRWTRAMAPRSSRCTLRLPQPGAVPGLPRQRPQGTRGRGVATSMEPVLAEVRRHRQPPDPDRAARRSWRPPGALDLVAMRRVVILLINQLSVAARRVGEGDFEARAPVTTRDEICHPQRRSPTQHHPLGCPPVYQELGHKNSELTHRAAESPASCASAWSCSSSSRASCRSSCRRRSSASWSRIPTPPTSWRRRPSRSRCSSSTSPATPKLSEQLEPRRLNHLVQTHFSSYLEQIQRQHGDINEHWPGTA